MSPIVRCLTVLLAAAALSACVASSAVPIRQNEWRLEVRGDGAAGTYYTRTQMMREAAALTLRQGYTHFTVREIDDIPTRQSPVKLALFGSFRVAQISNAVPVPPAAIAATAREPEVFRGVTVVMFRKGDPGIERAYNVLDYL